METPQSLRPEQIDDVLSTLANRHCRLVLSYFRDASEAVVSVDDLASAITRRDSMDREHVAIHLHHSALPKLADTGIIDYDTRTKTVRYHGHSELESGLDFISNMGGGWDKTWGKTPMMTPEMMQCRIHTRQTKTAH